MSLKANDYFYFEKENIKDKFLSSCSSTTLESKITISNETEYQGNDNIYKRVQ